MSDHKPGFQDQVRSFPRQFWVVNTMEIFERMSWYGWFTVMALYVTGSVETGGLGFTTETRGALQGIVPFFLYMFPVFTGALADRFGYKKTFIWAYIIMMLAYYLLGQFTSLPTFFLAFMFVAVGAALFKPVVVGTVAKVTTADNSSMGFGIFYMMVNVGGFAGPIVAGIMRGMGWDKVFLACSFWAFINLIIVILFYKEPDYEESQRQGGFGKILDNMVEVLGNGRFFITVFGVLFALMFANIGIFDSFGWRECGIFIPVWLVLNFGWDRIMPAVSEGRPALMQRMRCSNWRFALFLLIMSGFWTSFNQIFYTMPEYIRDFVETRPMTDFVTGIFGEDSHEKVATVSVLEHAEVVKHLGFYLNGEADGVTTSQELLLSKVRQSPAQLEALAAEHPGDATAMAAAAIDAGRQFNPEYIVNINAGGIVIFQVLVSFLMGRFHRFTTMIVGMTVAAVGIGMSFLAGGEGMIGLGSSVWLVAAGLLTFSFGEMMASPTSQEYVGRIAPSEKKALYMGYYFVAVALGNLFGGILSGELYGKLAKEMGRPDLMWLSFGGIMLFTALMFVAYNRFALPRDQADGLTP
ncbi:MFS transporter [bacterium]|nr:MAG: MFS transporter [bacterium]